VRAMGMVHALGGAGFLLGSLVTGLLLHGNAVAPAALAAPAGAGALVVALLTLACSMAVRRVPVADEREEVGDPA